MRRLLPLIAAILVLAGGGLVVAAVSGAFDGDDTAGSGSDAPAPAGETADRPTVDRFDADRAFRDLRHQVDLGPRPARSDTLRELADWLADRLPRGRLEPLPGGLQNIVGRLPGRGRRPILVAAHYDTKDIEGFVGANDGAGGTAAVLEIARALKRAGKRRRPELRFVLFDGEESPDDSLPFYSSGLRGSRPYARDHADDLRAMVLLDFVAERGAMRIPREAGSDRGLWNRLRAAARRVGAARTFPDRSTGQILDDHTPFARRGVPAIDLIDFTFDCWHETCDDMDVVSARSLDVAGETVVEMLLDWSR